MVRLSLIVTLLLAVAGPATAFADVRVPGIISDHMLLQRGVPARIFGKADPGEAVQRRVPRPDRRNDCRRARPMGSLAAAGDSGQRRK